MKKKFNVKHRWLGDYLKVSEGGPDIRSAIKEVNETVAGAKARSFKSIYIGNTTAVLESSTLKTMNNALKVFKKCGLIDKLCNEEGKIESTDDWTW